MFADLIQNVMSLTATSPLTSGAGSVVAACGALYLVTRLPEMLLLTATAGVYLGVALVHMHG